MNSIEVEGLSKSYVISHQTKKRPRSLRELLAIPFGRKGDVTKSADPALAQETFWALKDVSFSVGESERVAIIGGNGAGKSTLLKIMSRITEPTQGKVMITGRVASLLEVGTGFHPELTGRENIYLNGAILGMRKREITAKFDQIVAFSRIEKFIDTPVKHYSSGMYVRLAFSVSAWLDPDILIVDEVLSVGDQAFQRRCAQRMKELTGNGRTVIFVSHNMAAVKSMCEKALYLKNGRMVSFTPVEDATTQYVESILQENGQEAWHRSTFTYQRCPTEPESHIAPHAECIDGAIYDVRNEISATLFLHEPFEIHLRFNVLRDTALEMIPNFHFYNEDGAKIFISFPHKVPPSVHGTYTAICKIPAFLFNTGRFSMMLALSSYALSNPVHFGAADALRFEIKELPDTDLRRHGWDGRIPGFFRPRLDWAITRES